VTVLNALVGVVVTVRGRFESLNGTVVPFADTLTPASDRTASSVTIRLAEGWLLGAHAFVSTGAPLTGQTFAIVSLVRGEGNSAIVLATLAAGAITAQQRIGYPGSSIANSLDGAGALRSIAGTTPPVSTEISETVPTGARWQLISFYAQLVTSAVAGNRNVYMIIDDGVNELLRAPEVVTQIASASAIYIWLTGYGTSQYPSNVAEVATLPTPLFLGSGFRIRTSTVAFQAGDQWSLIRYLVREWLEVA